jgi:hypothetical protein
MNIQEETGKVYFELKLRLYTTHNCHQMSFCHAYKYFAIVETKFNYETVPFLSFRLHFFHFKCQLPLLQLYQFLLLGQGGRVCVSGLWLLCLDWLLSSSVGGPNLMH